MGVQALLLCMPPGLLLRAVKQTTPIKLVASVCFIWIVVLFAACGKVRYPNYYVLNIPPPVPQPTQLKPLPGSAAVREFSAPSFLRAGPIVYRASPEQLGFYHYDHWAVDPRSTVANAVVEDLQSRGVFRSVHLFDSRIMSDYLMTGSVDHLEEVDRGRSVFVNVGVSAQLLDVKSRAVLWQGVSSQTPKLDKRSVPGLVAGMSQAMDQVIAQLLSSMQTRLVQPQSSALSGTKEPKSESPHPSMNSAND